MMKWFKALPAELTPERRRRAERDSILSTCFGAMGDITLTDSAVIILFAAAIGAGDMFSMVTTAFMPLFNGLFIIPMAWLAARLGNQGLILRTCTISFVLYLVIVASPFFGSFAVTAMIGALMLFAVSHTGYVTGWFPMIDTFLTPERRGGYLGLMRFCWQLSASAFLFGIGLIIGKNPPLRMLQLVLLVSALIYLGRIVFISRIPVFPARKPESFGFGTGLATALANKPLVGYSVYLFVLNLAAYGTIPLTTLYLKRWIMAPDNVIVLISAVTLGGMLIGSLGAGPLLRRYGIRRVLLGVHLCYALTNLALFFIGREVMPPVLTYSVICLLLFVYSVTYANANIASTSEMMALATPGNKVMAMAFCGAFYYTGSGLSRLLSSLILGAGLLAPRWQIGGLVFSHYQTLYLFYTVAIGFAAMLLVVVPAVFPRGEYFYRDDH